MQLVTTVWFHGRTYTWLQLQHLGFVVTVDYIHDFHSFQGFSVEMSEILVQSLLWAI